MEPEPTQQWGCNPSLLRAAAQTEIIECVSFFSPPFLFFSPYNTFRQTAPMALMRLIDTNVYRSENDPAHLKSVSRHLSLATRHLSSQASGRRHHEVID